MDKNDLTMSVYFDIHEKEEKTFGRKQKYKELQPCANEIINRLGGNTEVAKICDVTLAAVSFWRKNGIPVGRLAQLKLKLSGQE